MHGFIILNFLDKINAFNHEKVLYQMSKCTFPFQMQCLFGRQKRDVGTKIQITFLLHELKGAIMEFWAKDRCLHGL